MADKNDRRTSAPTELPPPKGPSVNSQPVINNAPIGTQINNQGDIHISGPLLTWERLAVASAQWKDEIRDVIGLDIRVPRAHLRQEIDEALTQHRIVAVLGDSGVGKSVLVKDFLALPHPRGPSYCLNADELYAFGGPAIAATSDTLSALLATQPESWALLVLDGLDRLVGSSDLHGIARSIRALCLNKPESPWRLIVTCQTAAWDEMRRRLKALNANLDPVAAVHVTFLTETEVRAAAGRIDAISEVVVREELIPVLGRAKVLDLIATAAAEVGLPDMTHWVGESNVINWFWEDYICGAGRDDRHGAALQDLARNQANRREFATPVTDFVDTAQISLIGELTRLGILGRRHGTVRFAHDLYADYARQRYLVGQMEASRFDELRTYAPNPIWHRAIRLLGQHLLETGATSAPTAGSGGTEDWKRLLRVMGRPASSTGADAVDDDIGATEAERTSATGVDLLLEAIVFSAQSEQLLEQLASHLCADDGTYLRSLLFRFLHASATKPVLQDTPNSWRLPLPDYSIWTPIIRWMVLHKEDVLTLAPVEFLSIAEIWILSWEILGRNYGSVALRIQCVREMEDMILCVAERGLAPRSDRARLYRLVLVCLREYPDRVKPVVLKLAGRTSGPPQSQPPPRDEDVPEKWRHLLQRTPITAAVQGPVEPWPDGPRARPDDAFRKVALTPLGAELLVAAGIDFAKEVFSSLLIELRAPRDPRNYSSTHDQCGLTWTAWTAEPPFYGYPPARELLQKDTAVGLDFIVRLVDFATERWVEGWRIEQSRHLSFDSGPTAYDATEASQNFEVPRSEFHVAGGMQRYWGDQRVFDWNVGGAGAPPIAGALLMTLERWLYEKDEDGTLDPHVLTMLLKATKSMAIVGVLLNLSLKRPALLLGPLEPLLESIVVVYFGHLRSKKRGRDERKYTLMAWGDTPGARREAAIAWHGAEHLAKDFVSVVSALFEQSGLEWPTLELARRAWVEVRDAHAGASNEDFQIWLDEVIAYFDKDNWEHREIDGQKGWVYVRPDSLQRRHEEAVRRFNSDWQPVAFLMHCRKLLDENVPVSEKGVLSLLSFAGGHPAHVGGDVDWMVGSASALKCAAASVATLRLPELLDQRPELKQQCEDWLVEACLEQRTKRMLSLHLGGLADWDFFCAAAIPRIWAACPNEPKLRKALGILVGATYDNTRAHTLPTPEHDLRSGMFVDLAARRHEHRDDFQRLLHLAVWFARLQCIGHAGPPQMAPDVDKTFQRLVDDFAKGRLKPLPDDWPHLASVWPRGLRRPKWPPWVEEKGLDQGFDVGALVSSMGWLRVAATDTSASDRASLIALLGNLGSVVIEDVRDAVDEPGAALEDMSTNRKGRSFRPGELVPAKDARWSTRFVSTVKNAFAACGGRGKKRQRERRYGATPHLLEYTIAEWCAACIVREPDSFKRRGLWEPWMSLPHSRHSWVEILLGKIYREGFTAIPATAHFADALREMFEYSLAPGRWLDPAVGGYGASEVARAFLGEGWTAERKSLAIALRVYWERWVSVAMNWPRCASSFLHFLAAPAMLPLRTEGLSWVARSHVEAWISESENRDTLAAFLKLVWDEHMKGRVLDAGAYGNLVELLDRLVSLKNVEAVRLAGRMAGGVQG